MRPKLLLLFLLLTFLSSAFGAEPGDRLRVPPEQQVPKPWAEYGKRIETRLNAKVKEQLDFGAYVMSVNIQLWLDPAGKITRLQVATGNKNIDQRISNCFAGESFGPVPKDLPMPLSFRVRAWPTKR